MTYEAIWIEDDRDTLEEYVTILADYGLEIKGVESAKEGIEEISNRYLYYDFVMLDLDMPEMDGVEAYKKIRDINSQIPIMIVSAHLGEPLWDDKIDSINEKMIKVEKPLPIFTSMHFDEIVNTITDVAAEYRENRVDPFEIELDDYLCLPFEKIVEVNKIATEINRIFVNNFFARNEDCDWIVIAGSHGNVIESGSYKNEPFPEDLNKIAQRIKKPIFTFTRPRDVVEEIGSSKWSYKKETKDYYPAVRISINRNQNEHIFSCDFDTGSNLTYLSQDYLHEHNLVERRLFLLVSELWGEDYFYVNETIKGRIFGKKLTRKIDLSCRLVVDWNNSPLVKNHKNRIGLVGRNIFGENEIRILLDGTQKTTDLVEE
jgi:CheY-like chemotaxis protein